jgi:hypothetical protein
MLIIPLSSFSLLLKSYFSLLLGRVVRRAPVYLLGIVGRFRDEFPGIVACHSSRRISLDLPPQEEMLALLIVEVSVALARQTINSSSVLLIVFRCISADL